MLLISAEDSSYPEELLLQFSIRITAICIIFSLKTQPTLCFHGVFPTNDIANVHNVMTKDSSNDDAS